MHDSEYCATCEKIRFLGDDNVWSHWVPAGRFTTGMVEEATVVRCDHCTSYLGKHQRELVFADMGE